MIWFIFLAAFALGTDAAEKLDHAHPHPGAWFEAALTLVLVLGGLIFMIFYKDE